MATIVLITIRSGPNLASQPSYVVWESSLRLVDGVVTVIPAPGPVRLDSSGSGQVTIPAGIWYVTEVVPGAASRRRAVIVPESDTPVQYSTLFEVTNPADIGFGPTWEQLTLAYAMIAQKAAEDVAGFEAGDIVRTVNLIGPDENGNVSLSFEGEVTADSISDASSIGRELLRATDADAARAILGAGTGDGESGGSNVPDNVRYQNTDGTWPTIGTAPAGMLMHWIATVAGSSPPPYTDQYARFPSLYYRTA